MIYIGLQISCSIHLWIVLLYFQYDTFRGLNIIFNTLLSITLNLFAYILSLLSLKLLVFIRVICTTLLSYSLADLYNSKVLYIPQHPIKFLCLHNFNGLDWSLLAKHLVIGDITTFLLDSSWFTFIIFVLFIFIFRSTFSSNDFIQSLIK